MKQGSGATHTEPCAVRQQKPMFQQIEWQEAKPRLPADHFIKNTAVAAAVLLCLIALRNGAVPQAKDLTDTVLAAASTDDLLNDRLGKLSFVSALFPEAVLVFGEGSHTPVMAMPVTASAQVHAWSEQEPYVAWASNSTNVFAALSGEVSGVYHGPDEEIMVQITDGSGNSVICGNLRQANVSLGDYVEQGELIGWIEAGSYCSFEAQHQGVSIDPMLAIKSE